MKFPNHRNWQTKDHDVSEKRERAVDGAANSLVLAVSVFYGLVVVESNWSADCEINEEGYNSPTDSVGHVCPGKKPELVGWKQAHVEKQNRSLDTH